MSQMNALYLTAADMLRAVDTLDGVRLPARTLAKWARSELVPASVQHDGTRGRYHPRLYNLSDLARLRLVVNLRWRFKLSLGRVAVVMAHIERDLGAELLRSSTAGVLVVEPYTYRGRIVVRKPGGAVEVSLGGGAGDQLELPLASVVDGNAEVAAQIRAAR